MFKGYLKNKQLKTFFIVLLISLLISALATLIYSKLPPFYIYSFNYALVPAVEQNENNFNYNNFYQGEFSKNITQSISLFAANGDFKQLIEKQAKINILYLMSKTNGSNLINLKLVSLSKIDETSVEKIIYSVLEKGLNYSVDDRIEVRINSMPDFNTVYLGGIPAFKFFSILFGTTLIVLSVFSLLKKYYAT